MCLIIDNEKHVRRKGFFKYECKPIKITEPITVYKILVHRVDGRFFTPYRHADVPFSDGRCKMLRHFTNEEFAEVGMVKKTLLGKIRAFKAGDGFHAFRLLEYALDEAAQWHNSNLEVHVHKAIIPIGAYVYYGYGGDICASDMTIFEASLN